MSSTKTAEPIETQFGMLGRVVHVLDGGARWRNLAKTVEQSVCGGDAAFRTVQMGKAEMRTTWWSGDERCDPLYSPYSRWNKQTKIKYRMSSRKRDS